MEGSLTILQQALVNKGLHIFEIITMKEKPVRRQVCQRAAYEDKFMHTFGTEHKDDGAVGDAVGLRRARIVGLKTGATVGLRIGADVNLRIGAVVGFRVGDAVGFRIGAYVGFRTGAAVVF
jgi:hypothetical protein